MWVQGAKRTVPPVVCIYDGVVGGKCGVVGLCGKRRLVVGLRMMGA